MDRYDPLLGLMFQYVSIGCMWCRQGIAESQQCSLHISGTKRYANQSNQEHECRQVRTIAVNKSSWQWKATKEMKVSKQKDCHRGVIIFLHFQK
jgi:hypothetical protein